MNGHDTDRFVDGLIASREATSIEDWLIDRTGIQGGAEEVWRILDRIEPVGDDRYICEHEAGHAVISVAVGLGAPPCANFGDGGIAHGVPASILDDPIRLVRQLLMRLGGPAQDSIRTGLPPALCLVFASAPPPTRDSRYPGSDSDYVASMTMACWLVSDPSHVESFCHHVLGACVTYLRLPEVQKAVRSISNLLHRRKAASAKQIAERCRDLPKFSFHRSPAGLEIGVTLLGR